MSEKPQPDRFPDDEPPPHPAEPLQIEPLQIEPLQIDISVIGGAIETMRAFEKEIREQLPA